MTDKKNTTYRPSNHAWHYDKEQAKKEVEESNVKREENKRRSYSRLQDASSKEIKALHDKLSEARFVVETILSKSESAGYMDTGEVLEALNQLTETLKA